MIAEFFPGGSHRYLALPVLGPLMDHYAGWLHEQHYTWRSGRYELRMAARVADYLKERAVCRIEDLNQQHLDECHSWFRQKFSEEAGSVVVLMRFLHKAGYVDPPHPSLPSNPVDVHVSAFMAHLREVRGYAPSTIRRQGQIAAEFLTWLAFPDNPHRLSSLAITDLEGFIQHLRLCHKITRTFRREMFYTDINGGRRSDSASIRLSGSRAGRANAPIGGGC